MCGVGNAPSIYVVPSGVFQIAISVSVNAANLEGLRSSWICSTKGPTIISDATNARVVTAEALAYALSAFALFSGT